MDRVNPQEGVSIVASDHRLHVAILGARGIGRIHAQLFHTLGADICAVLGSTDKTAAIAAQAMARAFGHQVQAFSRLEKLLDMPDLDAVSICTPPHLHLAHMLASFNRAKALPVFCEKPLFWSSSITHDEIQRGLACLESHPHRRLFVNTSNAALLDSVRTQLPSTDEIDSFCFQYYTQGQYRGKNIASDLLPHGFSLLLHLLGQRDMTDLSEEITPHTYGCQFHYGGCFVRFDFQERPDGPKAFAFAVNGRAFTRSQVGSGAAYRLFLHDSASGERIEVQNPFRTYIARFASFCHAPSGREADTFEEAAVNMRLMARILL
jgi:hypothetical protein